MQTVATVTRISRFEIPYLRSFIEFYVDFHRVNRMMFLVIPDDDLDEIQRYLHQNIGDRIKQIQFLRGRNGIWLKSYTPMVLDHAAED